MGAWSSLGWHFPKRLEKGRSVWVSIVDGSMTLTPTQVVLLVNVTDWHSAAGASLANAAPTGERSSLASDPDRLNSVGLIT